MHALQPYAEHEYTVKVETISSKFTTLNSSRISKVLFALEPESLFLLVFICPSPTLHLYKSKILHSSQLLTCESIMLNHI